MKLKDAGIDVEDHKVKKDIERLVGKTEGYTFDFVKEVIQGIYVDEIKESLLFERLNEIIKRNGRVVVSEEESKKIGFSLSNDKRCEGPYVEEDDEADSPNDDWATAPSSDVKIRGFVPHEIKKAFITNNDVPGTNPVVEDLDPVPDEPRNEVKKSVRIKEDD
jgi:hypothetical protein